MLVGRVDDGVGADALGDQVAEDEREDDRGERADATRAHARGTRMRTSTSGRTRSAPSMPRRA